MEMVMGAVEDVIPDVFQVENIFAKEGSKAPVMNLTEEVAIPVVQQEHLNTLRVQNVEKLHESDLFMNALSKRRTGCNAQMKHVAQLLKGSMDQVNEEGCKHRILQRK